MAAAHERLPHLQAEHLMVSCIECGGEGWKWVDSLDQACLAPVQSPFSTHQYTYYPDLPMPTFLHYCQGYHAKSKEGKQWSFYKRHLRADVFNFSGPHSVGCTAALLEMPPTYVGSRRVVPADASRVFPMHLTSLSSSLSSSYFLFFD